MHGSQVDGPRLFSVVPSNRIRGSEHKLEHAIFHVNVEDERALEQANQRGCGVSSGVTQYLSFGVTKKCNLL